VLDSSVDRSIISVVLSDPRLIGRVRDFMAAEDFVDPVCSYLFKAIEGFSADSFSWELLADVLQTKKDCPPVLKDPYSFLSDLVISAPIMPDLSLYSSLVSQRKLRSLLRSKLKVVSEEIENPSSSVVDIQNLLLNTISSFQTNQLLRIVSEGTVWKELKKDVIDISTTKFVGTGFSTLDAHLTWGLVPGHISVISGRPSMGKSTFRSNIERNLGKEGIYCVTISLEQSVVDEYFRKITQLTGLSFKDIVVGFRKKDPSFDMSVFISAVKEIMQWPHTFVEPKGSFNLSDIELIIQDIQIRNFSPAVVFIDLFSQISDISRVTESGRRAAVISQKMMELRTIARRLSIHFCLVVQLRRMGRDWGKIDRQEFYKDSGGYEENADLMFQLDRPGYWDPENVEDNVLQVFIGKQRQGTRGMIVPLVWDVSTLSVKDEVGEENKNIL